jgi:hypothetical protein
MKQAVQEKFRQAVDNIDNLNGWLDQVERKIASLDNISEDSESLKSQINTIKVRISFKMIKVTREVLRVCSDLVACFNPSLMRTQFRLRYYIHGNNLIYS